MKTILGICVLIFIWGIVFPSSLPRNFARFTIVVTTAGFSNAAYFSVKGLAESGSSYFLIKAIHFGGAAMAVSVGVGVRDYVDLYGENHLIDVAVLEAFSKTNPGDINRISLIWHIFSSKRKYSEDTRREIDAIYREKLNDKERLGLLRIMKNSKIFQTPFLQHEVLNFRKENQDTDGYSPMCP